MVSQQTIDLLTQIVAQDTAKLAASTELLNSATQLNADQQPTIDSAVAEQVATAVAQAKAEQKAADLAALQ